MGVQVLVSSLRLPSIHMGLLVALLASIMTTGVCIFIGLVYGCLVAFLLWLAYDLGEV
jgi:hypothetical protein